MTVYGGWTGWTALGFVACVVSIVAGLYQELSQTQNKMPGNWGKVSAIIGWFYFMCWSISFYPQVVLNFSRKSVVGLSFDYQALNLLGFLCYAVFNIVTFFPTHIREEYKEAKNGDTPDVEANDVVFALHAVALTSITMTQICIYDRGDQRFSSWSIATVACFSAAIVIYGIICALSDGHVGATNTRSWLSWST